MLAYLRLHLHIAWTIKCATVNGDGNASGGDPESSDTILDLLPELQRYLIAPRVQNKHHLIFTGLVRSLRYCLVPSSM